MIGFTSAVTTTSRAARSRRRPWKHQHRSTSRAWSLEGQLARRGAAPPRPARKPPGRITACRVVIKAPGEHHQKGGPLRGEHSPGDATQPRRQSRPHAAGLRALRRGRRRHRRRLQAGSGASSRIVRRLQRQVKHHSRGPRAAWRGSTPPASSASSPPWPPSRSTSIGTACSMAASPGSPAPAGSSPRRTAKGSAGEHVRLLGKHIVLRKQAGLQAPAAPRRDLTGSGGSGLPGRGGP